MTCVSRREGVSSMRFVARGGLDAVKISYTTLFTVEQYVNQSYAVSLTPLQIILVTPVSNARVAEAVIQHVLAPYRLHDKHELFELN